MLAMQGFILLASMLTIYIGARLVTGSITAVLYETLFALVVAGAAQLAMLRWPPAVALFVFAHGAYDAIIGPHTGVAGWYPPLCAGFDFVAGVGLFLLLLRKHRAQTTDDKQS